MAFGARLRLAAKALTGLFPDKSADAAYSLLAGLYPASVGAIPQRGTREILEGYSSMPWLRAVSDRISQKIAETEWQLYAPSKGKRTPRKVQKASAVERRKMLRELQATATLRPLDDHILLDALKHSNDYLVGAAVLRVSQVHIDLVGESFWIKERNGLGAPVGFWPVPPHWVISTPTPTSRFYRVQFAAWHGDIPDTEIIWFCNPDPANPYHRGSGIARSLVDELETDEYAARHTRMTFINRARPDLIIWPEETKTSAGEMSSENAQRLGERWRAEHQGFWRAALPFFATRKLGVHELQQSFKELDLVPLREHERNTIRQVFGIPPEMLGIVEPGAARATIETGEYIFEKHCIEPRREFLRSVLQERLVPEYDERLTLDYVSTVNADSDQQMKAATAQPHIFTVDEWREMAGKPPLPNNQGQVHMVTGLLQPRADLSVAPEPPPTPAPFQPRQRAIDLSGACGEDWTDAVAACKDAGDHDLSAYLTHAFGGDPSALPELSRRLDRKEATVRRLLASQLKELRERTPLNAIRHALTSGDKAAVLAAVPRAAWAAALRQATKGWLRDAFLVGAQHGAEVARLTIRRDDSLPFNTVNPEALKWAAEHAAELVVGIDAATEAGLRSVIGDAIAEGWGAERTARVIYESIGLTDRQATSVLRFAERLASDESLSEERLTARVERYADAQIRARALTIARTELITAGNTGQQRLWDLAISAGVLRKDRMLKKWIVTLDELLEAECEALGDDDPVPIDGLFNGGYDHPPAHPNCRCSIGLVMAGSDEADEERAPNAALAKAIADGLAPLRVAVEALAQRQITVTVPEREVHVHAPPRTVRKVERDAEGFVTQIVEESRDASAS